MTTRFDALVEVGRYDDALRAAYEERARDPQSYVAACHVAQALAGLERWADALAAANEAAGMLPEDEWAHRLRSLALREMGRHREAVAAAEEAVRLDDDMIETWSMLFHAYLHGRPDDALRVAHHMVSTWPGDVRSHAAIGLVGLHRGQWQLAERAFRHALTIEPGNSAALHNLGVALESQGRKREAVALLSEAVRADPADDHSRTVLGGFATGLALRGAGIAVLFVVLVVGLLPEGDPSGDSLLATVMMVVCWLAYAGYRVAGAIRLASLPAAARIAVEPIVRKRDRTAFVLLGFVLCSAVISTIGEGDWVGLTLAVPVAVPSVVWAFDGRLGLPRFADAVDRLVVRGPGRSGPPRA